ncbi:MAG: adenylate kinase [Candidatus Omnitrophica bacterium 4484_213]|nr:MAG: adenylate kinase [Candidatus Omnitrophica bacterium 4484_213]
MNLVFLGPPGAGKGTQAEVVCKHFSIEHISSGDLLRGAVRSNSLIGKKAKGFIEKGLLVPDEIVVQIVSEEIKKDRKGFVLDGFPRNLAQAEFLNNSLSSLNICLDRVLNFVTSPQKIIERLSGRRICPKCQAIYHIKNMPPLKEGICDKCGSSLLQRDDDKEETIRERLKVYTQLSQPLIEYYRKKGILVDVNGDLEVQVLFEVIKGILQS